MVVQNPMAGIMRAIDEELPDARVWLEDEVKTIVELQSVGMIARFVCPLCGVVVSAVGDEAKQEVFARAMEHLEGGCNE
jgi:hypothetical protein